MKGLAFDNDNYGTASVVAGIVSIIFWPAAFLMQAPFLFYAAPIVAVAGFLLGVLNVKNPKGAIGIFLNAFGALLSVFAILGIAHLFER